MNLVPEALIFLGAAVLIVPLLKKAGLGTVFGYLATGIIIGPFGLGLAGDIESTRHFAELGIVLLFFVIGLEMQPARLWALRGSIFGMGGLQMLATTAVLFLIAMALGLGSAAAVIAALSLSLSSTAASLEMLAEKHELASLHGRSATAVILFQDLAIVPVLATVGYLSPGLIPPGTVDIWLAVGLALLGLCAIIGAGRYLLRPFLRMLAATRNQGLLTGGALFVLLGAAQLMESVDIPMELGAFLAGVLLADSEYRNELESRIEPFKGLLLGLFFIAFGMSIDLGRLLHDPLTVFGLTAGLIIVKFMVLFLIGKLFRHRTHSAIDLGLMLSQAGEFAFVILSLAVAVGAIDSALSSRLGVVVALSMAATPVIIAFYSGWRRRFGGGQDTDAGGRRQRIFVSYSRSDTGQALKLVSCLESEGFEISIDTRDLPFGEEWQAELDYFIRQADAVIWLVSRASIQSAWCRWELRKVSGYRKRLVPVAIEAVRFADLPDTLGKIQMLPSSGIFEATDKAQVRELTDALRADRHWIKEYTRLAERARLWRDNGSGADWLLRGSELEAAEKWRSEMPQTAPIPDAAVLDLIRYSRIAESG
jgi:monovalent cation:proton antiporter-2 (CPA2) family protein